MKELLQKHGIDTSNLDLTADPKNDFYRYCAGGWKDKHPLQPEYSSFGIFNLLAEQARDNVNNLISNIKNDTLTGINGTIQQKISDLYSLGMDQERLSKEGNAPLEPILKRIEDFTKEKLAATIAWLSFGLDSTFFGYGVGPDFEDSNTNILHIMEAGIGLGDRDYYLEKNDNNIRILKAYREYISKLMHRAGYDAESSLRISNTVIEIETEYAKHKMTREQRRDPLLRHNIMTQEELENKYANIPWSEIFELSGIPQVEYLNVCSPQFIEFINKFIPEFNERQIKDLMAYGAVSSSIGVLCEDFYDLEFEMFGKVMSGAEEKKPRWKRSQGLVNSLFGEAIGQLYVNKYFPPKNKEYMIHLVENLRDALRLHIKNLKWMSSSTKNKALAKLEKMSVKIGYPDKWKNYEEIHIDPAKSYLENVLKASEWFTRDNYSKLSKPVDKDEWHMYPQTVNAYYSPQKNEICFPAGILQPPFFDIDADDALNYGGIGVVIGHEMTHGFDDSGRHYDLNGNLDNWWSPEDESNFNKLAAGLEAQFNAIEIAPGVNANGKFTLGENIADQGGLRIALSAYLLAHPDALEGQTVIEGYSPLQRFYISYGGIWANNIRPEEVLLRTQTDPHSLSENRVNATLRNIQPFMESFSIKEGDKMFNPISQQIVIW